MFMAAEPGKSYRILAGEGYAISQVDNLFTEETRSALTQWQIDRGYEQVDQKLAALGAVIERQREQ